MTGPTAALAVLSVIITAMTWVWIVSASRRNASIVDICWGPGFALLAWVYCLLFKTFRPRAIGDYQLDRFKAVPANRGRVLDSGLWRYTRHPNYFGDAVLWWGVFVIACSTPEGWLSVPVPADDRAAVAGLGRHPARATPHSIAD